MSKVLVERIDFWKNSHLLNLLLSSVVSSKNTYTAYKEYLSDFIQTSYDEDRKSNLNEFKVHNVYCSGRPGTQDLILVGFTVLLEGDYKSLFCLPFIGDGVMGDFSPQQSYNYILNIIGGLLEKESKPALFPLVYGYDKDSDYYREMSTFLNQGVMNCIRCLVPYGIECVKGNAFNNSAVRELRRETGEPLLEEDVLKKLKIQGLAELDYLSKNAFLDVWDDKICLPDWLLHRDVYFS